LARHAPAKVGHSAQVLLGSIPQIVRQRAHAVWPIDQRRAVGGRVAREREPRAGVRQGLLPDLLVARGLAARADPPQAVGLAGVDVAPPRLQEIG
jgi:hypothetical protein